MDQSIIKEQETVRATYVVTTRQSSASYPHPCCAMLTTEIGAHKRAAQNALACVVTVDSSTTQSEPQVASLTAARNPQTRKRF